MRVRGVVLGLLIAAIAAPAHASNPSPCSLASAADVKAAFGGTVGKGRVDTTTPDPTCHYSVKHSNLGRSGEAVVFASPEQTAATFKIAKKYVPGAVTVTGIATAAFYNPHTTAIELLKGNSVANAQGIFFGANAAKIKADVVVLAKAVAKHV